MSTTITTNTRELADELLAKAHESSAGRAAKGLRTGQDVTLRHTMLALTAGSSLSEHENPGEATLLVYRGRVVLDAGDDQWELGEFDYLEIPPRRHGVRAVSDSVVLLTTVPRP